MKKNAIIASVSAAALFASTAAIADPTRGFSQQWATVTAEGDLTADLGTGNPSGQRGRMLGIRTGLGPGELILNHADVTYGDQPSTTVNSALYKFPIPDMPELAVYGGAMLIDDDSTGNDFMHLIAGVAYTVGIDDFTLNANGEIIIYDDDDPAAPGGNDDEIIRLGGGAFYHLPEIGVFNGWSLGAELNILLADDDDGFNDEASIHLGARWDVNERTTLDMVFYEDRMDGDQFGIPGRLTLNVQF